MQIVQLQEAESKLGQSGNDDDATRQVCITCPRYFYFLRDL